MQHHLEVGHADSSAVSGEASPVFTRSYYATDEADDLYSFESGDPANQTTWRSIPVCVAHEERQYGRGACHWCGRTCGHLQTGSGICSRHPHQICSRRVAILLVLQVMTYFSMSCCTRTVLSDQRSWNVEYLTLQTAMGKALVILPD
jgi:hypothetical protein